MNLKPFRRRARQAASIALITAAVSLAVPSIASAAAQPGGIQGTGGVVHTGGIQGSGK